MLAQELKSRNLSVKIMYKLFLIPGFKLFKDRNDRQKSGGRICHSILTFLDLISE